MLSFGYLWIALTNKLDTCLKKRCPPIYDLLFTSKYTIIRQLFSVVIGFFAGYVFYSYIVYRFSFEDKMERVIRYTIVSLITLMFTVSIEMRAICSLVLPTFLGRSTRNYLIASVIITLINEPLLNTLNNTVVVSKWFYCMVGVGVDQGMGSTKLVYGPGVQIITQMVRDNYTFMTNDSKYTEMMSKYTQKFVSKAKRNKTEEKSLSDKYKEKLKKFCDSNLQNKLDQCYENLISPETSGWFFWVDWPMRIRENLKPFEFCKNEKFRRFMNKTCGFNENGTLDDDPSLMNAIKDLELLDMSNIKISHNLSLPNMSSILQYKQVLKEVEYYTQTAKDYSVISAKVAKNLFLVVFLFVFFSSKSYHKKYLTDIKFDNNYITTYFRRIDARRKKGDKLSLLPLKRIEKIDLIDPFGWKLTKIEKSHAKISTILLTIFLVFIYLVQQMDVLLYDLIDLIRFDMNIDVIQYGFNEMHPNVTGKDGYMGWMASNMKRLFKYFDFETHIYKGTTFNICRPNPHQTPDSVSDGIYMTFVLICLLNYMEMYSLRCRRVICSYFYRIRAKKRTLFLYNQTLKKRKGFLRYSIQRIQQLVNQKLFRYPDDQIVNTFAYGLINEKNCGLLIKIIRKLFSYFVKSKCIVCDEYLQKNQKSFKCKDSKCNLNYCNQCWDECHQRCLVCSVQLFDEL